MDDAHHLHDTTDAAAWAKEFCKRWPSALCQIPGKEGVSGGDDFEATMVGWFANAIMAGVDSEARGSAARLRELEAQLAEARTEGFRQGIAAAAQAADGLRKTLWTSEPARCVSDIEALHEVEAAIRALPTPADLGAHA